MSQPAQPGLLPTPIPDIPITACLILVFALLAGAHMTIFQRNRIRGHLFIFSVLTFGYAMSRVVANILRLVWSTRQTNIDVQLASTIFLNAGVLLVYVINNILSWRLVRSAAPRIGWNPALRGANKAMLWAVLPMIVTLIVIIVCNVKTPGPRVARGADVMAKFANTYFLIVALTPVPLLAVAAARGRAVPGQDVGVVGSFGAKVLVLSVAVLLALVEATYRAGGAWAPARTASAPGWWSGKPAFYVLNFGIDILVMLVYLVSRFDLRFWVPNGSSKVRTYAVQGETKGEEMLVEFVGTTGEV